MHYSIAELVHLRSKFLWSGTSNNIKRLYPPQECPQTSANGNSEEPYIKIKAGDLGRKRGFFLGFMSSGFKGCQSNTAPALRGRRTIVQSSRCTAVCTLGHKVPRGLSHLRKRSPTNWPWESYKSQLQNPFSGHVLLAVILHHLVNLQTTRSSNDQDVYWVLVRICQHLSERYPPAWTLCGTPPEVEEANADHLVSLSP